MHTLILVALGGGALVAALEVAITGVVLARDYRPVTPGGDVSLLPGAVQRADDVRRWHEAGLAVAVVLVAIAVVVAVVVAFRRGRSGEARWVPAFVAVGAIVAVASLAAAAATWPDVRWDQLAIWAVELDTDVSGLWYAAFGDDVRFVLVGDAEVSKGDYAVSAVAHVGLPFVAVAGLLGSYVPLLTHRHRHHEAYDHGQNVGTTTTGGQ